MVAKVKEGRTLTFGEGHPEFPGIVHWAPGPGSIPGMDSRNVFPDWTPGLDSRTGAGPGLGTRAGDSGKGIRAVLPGQGYPEGLPGPD